MALGTFNPKDDTRTSSVREAHVLTGANVRKWFDTTLNTRPKAQDLNIILAQFYAAGDYYAAADTEGNDNYLLSTLQSILDNTEWTVSGATGTADISGKKGFKGRITNAASAGITSFGTPTAGKTHFIYINSSSTGVRILPNSTVQTPGVNSVNTYGMPLYLNNGDAFIIACDSGGTFWRVFPLLATTAYDNATVIATNGDFNIWQEATSFTLASSTTTFLADHWKGRRQATGMVVSRQAGFSGSRYCLRVVRTAGDTSASPLILGYQIPSDMATLLAGKQVIVSFDFRQSIDQVGQIALGATMGVQWTNGAGIDESPSLTNGVFTTANGAAQGGSVLSPGFPTNNAWTRITVAPIPVTPGTTESLFRIIYTPTTTAAGSLEYFEIANFKIEVGAFPTPFVPEPSAVALMRAKRRYEKSCPSSVFPATNLGLGNGERRFAATTAGAVAGFVGQILFEVEKASNPSIILLNPAAANNQVRNITDSADLSSASVANITTRGFDLTATGTAGTAVGEVLGVGFIADSRL